MAICDGENRMAAEMDAGLGDGGGIFKGFGVEGARRRDSQVWRSSWRLGRVISGRYEMEERISTGQSAVRGLRFLLGSRCFWDLVWVSSGEGWNLSVKLSVHSLYFHCHLRR